MTNIFEDDTSPEVSVPELATPKAPHRKLNMSNDNDRNELWTLLKIKTLMSNPGAIAKDAPTKVQEDNIKRDAQGNVAGTKNSVMTGVHATTKNQGDLFKALKADALKRYGIKE